MKKRVFVFVFLILSITLGAYSSTNQQREFVISVSSDDEMNEVSFRAAIVTLGSLETFEARTPFETSVVGNNSFWAFFQSLSEKTINVQLSELKDGIFQFKCGSSLGKTARIEGRSSGWSIRSICGGFE